MSVDFSGRSGTGVPDDVPTLFDAVEEMHEKLMAEPPPEQMKPWQGGPADLSGPGHAPPL